MARNSALSSIQTQAALKKANTRNSAACTVLRAVMTPNAATEQHGGKDVEQGGGGVHAIQRYGASAALAAAISFS